MTFFARDGFGVGFAARLGAAIFRMTFFARDGFGVGFATRLGAAIFRAVLAAPFGAAILRTTRFALEGFGEAFSAFPRFAFAARSFFRRVCHPKIAAACAAFVRRR